MSDTRKVVLELRYCPSCYGQFGAKEVCPTDGTPLRALRECPLIGKVFAERYVIDSVLGLGGMSIVYKATHKLMNRTVAIKMLKKKLVEDVLLLERFKLEAQAASSLSHQNIITIYDFGVTTDGEPYLVMDCLDGQSLEDVIEHRGRLPVGRALPIFKQICDGLEAAHKKGIVHRDLKPANVVLLDNEDGSEQVKLVDFGIAKIMPQSGQQAQQLTQTGEVFGSPIYMSPEQCMGRPLDARADLYSLGCLMYETLTSQPPFMGDSFLETMNKHVGEAPKPFAEVAPGADIPAEVEAVVMQCMAKKPNDRFASAVELRDHLSALSVLLAGAGGVAGGAAELAGGAGRASGAFAGAGGAGGAGSDGLASADSAVRASGGFAGAGAGGASGVTNALAAKLGFNSGANATVKQAEARKPQPPLWLIAGLPVVVLVGGVFAFISLWPGPDSDRGTILDKTLFQFQLSGAEDAIRTGDYANAQTKLVSAEGTAKKIGDGGARLEAVLKQRAYLYDKWEGHAIELEQANKAITQLQVEELRGEYQRRLALLGSLSLSGGSGVEASNAKLRAEAQIPGILSTAERLYGRAMYLDCEKMLTRTLELERKMLGEDSLSLAPLESKLADCYIAERNAPLVRPLLAHSADLWQKNQHGHETDYARALNKLGQFDLDQSDFKSATRELEEALTVARNNGNKDTNVMCLRSYADLLRQTGEKARAQKAFAEADAIEKAQQK